MTLGSEKKINFKKIFDEVEQLIYIADPISYEIIYVNKTTNTYFPGDLIGKKCHDIFQGLDKPCSFCTNDKLFGDPPISPYIWDYYYKKLERWFHIFDQAIEWEDGRMVRFEMAEDMTEKIKTMFEMKESTEQFKELFNNLRTGVAIYESVNKGENFLLLDLNVAGMMIEDVKKDEILGKSLKDCFPNLVEYGLFDVFKKVWKTEISEYHPIKISKNEKILSWKEFYINKLSNGNIFTVFNDLTEEKIAEQKLNESEEKYRSLIEGLNQVGIGIDIVSLDYKVLYQNKVLQEKFGDLTGELCYVKYMNRESPCDPCPTRNAIKNDTVERMELMGGDERYYELFSAPYPNIDGSVDKAVEIVMDITERVQIESQIKESEEKFRTIAEQSYMGLFILQDGKIKYCNQAFADITDSSIEEILKWKQRHIFNRIFEDDQPLLLDFYKKNLNGDPIETLTINFRIKDKSGNIKWVQSSEKRITYERKPASLTTFFDITDRKRLEENLEELVKERTLELKDSEKYNQLLFDTSPIGLALCRMDGTLVDINQTYADIIGRGIEETKKLTYWDITPKKYMEDEQVQLKSLELTGKYGPFEKEYIHNEGHLVPVNLSGLIIERGGENYIWSSVEDITKRKQAEESLKQEMKFSNSIIQGLPGIFFVFTQEGKFLIWNKNLELITGYTGQEISKMHPIDFIAQDDREKIAKAIQQVFVQGHNIVEGNLLTRRNNLIPYYFSAQKIDIKGEPNLMGTGIDLSELKKAEQRIIDDRNRFFAILDGIDDVIYVADPDTHELLYVNNAFKVNWGNQVLGKKCYKVIQDREEPCPFCTNDIIFGESLGKTYYWEFQNEVNKSWYRCADRAIRWINEKMVRFELASDITPIKEAELKLKEIMEELKRSNTDLEQFAYVASHDLQEPLRMVASFTQLLERKYSDKLDKDGKEFIQFAVDGATRMKALIDDLLIFSRVGSRGKEFTPTNMNDVVNSVLNNLKYLIEENNAIITVEDLPVIKADNSQMIQLFQNLIINAIKFHRSGIDPIVEISSEIEENFWRFTVKDNGIGIEPEYFERVFIIFQRLHRKDEYSGTGIGLAVCKKIIQRHGGKIWIESEPQKGSSFYFQIKKPDI